MIGKQEEQIQTAVRLPKSILARLDKQAEHMSQSVGTRITRAEALRVAATEGLAVLEAKRKKR